MSMNIPTQRIQAADRMPIRMPEAVAPHPHPQHPPPARNTKVIDAKQGARFRALETLNLMDVPSFGGRSSRAERHMQQSDWKQAVEAWQQLPSQEKARRRWQRIPRNVAQSMSFAGEPVSQVTEMLM